MKVKILSTLAITFATVVGSFSAGLAQDRQSNVELTCIQKANIMALSSNSNETTSAPPSPQPRNTGPREEKKCYGGGHKMVCLGVNTNICTDSDCY